MEYLTLAEVLLLHAHLVQRTGGSGDMREIGLPESALARPQAMFDQTDLYPDIWSKCNAAYLALAQTLGVDAAI